ncbi:MAG TPA: 50S ribosomal protein L30 [Pseudomonadota bacterium]|jgi:large subunit ribosomal protein L30|nr:50S ribosomal protein L30 [Pseudomonadota bacterium]
MALKLKVTLVRSGNSQPERQQRTIRALGLKRLNKSRVLPDNLAVRGMIRQVAHVLQVERVE